jgi:hypothetical protein
MALTDHDTVAGVPAAVEAGARIGIRVVGGCEFSSAAPWGEMHVLGYFLPSNSAELESFLERCRADRVRRGREMVTRLQRLGVALEFDDVLRQSNGAAVGRPHVARVLERRTRPIGRQSTAARTRSPGTDSSALPISKSSNRT